MKYTNQLLIILSTLLAIASCGGGVIKPTITSLIDTEWKLININGIPFSGETQPTLHFKAKRVSGFAGCNRYFSNYSSKENGSISFGSIGKTKMLCSRSDSRNIETQFIRELSTANSFSINDGELTIKGSTGILQFKR